mmetsp:Transcript_2074/g.2938  ORF Transcript_2074/g.2938 Transcript_2074/m.2938 type:complete len:868 (-) Transcript_2074:237-2840(-)|eukprot:CAMPEP_0118690672 /NCGR_PEP_ID=MMETSP0800-20121206/10249_1 /TAXON_ID=210618 ORGANISM="Striatella unipunctata, Strain CCMP2910" /NCGR_SAMPLE_ID=MMETSP0800 /ASSEMBLY_ACC=CAM_ASM_000638 /LENGTH=867 /DNA_ID=CAMNT_0006588355 /DNA_START=58 /DNA_END=2661 /DNA_ORIENTATION=-
MADLTATLLGAQSPDPQIQKPAEDALKNAETSNLPEFIGALATQLATEGIDVTARQLAGLHLKNLLIARDSSLQLMRHDRWKALDAGVRTQVKSLLLAALRSTEKPVRQAAAQACAEVAAIELPFKQWPDFISTMMENVSGAQQPDEAKISSLECLGYTCERIAEIDGAPELEPDTTNPMLTAIVDGIRVDRPNPIRLAAAKALRNSLLFTQKNMEQKMERDMIIKTICEATQSTDAAVREAAYDCICQVAYLYYEKLNDYMETFLTLSFRAIKTDEEHVAKQAVEFWSTLCECEMEILDENAELAERDLPPERTCVKYVENAMPHLGPILLETLTKQEEDADLDDEGMNLSMAGTRCLRLVAQTVEDSVLQVVMPFVTQNIKNTEWRLREAATMAFNCVLEGPSLRSLGQYVNQSVPILLEALNDPVELVRDTTANTIGLICELHVRSIPELTFPALVDSLMSKLTEAPRVSKQAAYAIHNLGAAFASDNTGSISGTNAISGYMPMLLQNLLTVADREDADELSLRESAFQALSVLIQYSAPDCRPLYVQFLPAMIDRLNKSFQMQIISSTDRDQRDSLQGGICGILHTLFFKLEKDDIAPNGDLIMLNLLNVFQQKNSSCHEEAYCAVGALADKLEEDFEKYLQALDPFLMAGLHNAEAFRVCTVAVGLVGDLCRSVEMKILPYCDNIMQALLLMLQNQDLHRSVKPPVLACIGDIAVAIGGEFGKYMNVSMAMLTQAAQTRAPEDDEDLIEYVNTLREGILEAYTGIVSGLVDGDKLQGLAPFVEKILEFLELIASDTNRDLEVLSKAVGLLGDLANAMGSSIRELLQKDFVSYLMHASQQTGDPGILNVAGYAQREVSRALQG